MSSEAVPPASCPLTYVDGPAPVTGRIRVALEDFLVDEQLGFAASGDGEHVLVQVRKRGANTEWVARQLAEHADVRPGDVGFAGLKDRAAVTTQWFSVHLPGRAEPDWAALASGEFQVLDAVRHHRKLRRGALRGNRFTITVRELAGDHAALEERLQRIAERGVPNYFGEQRFGRDGANLQRADALLRGRLRRVSRHQRGLYLSAARSFLFNCVLAQRVTDGSWDRGLAGELMMLDGSHSVFAVDVLTDELQDRLAAMDIHPTGPLWGRGRSSTRGDCQALERAVLAPFAAWRDGLEHAGLSQERRALRVPVAGLRWDWPADEVLQLSFALPAGSYATAVLRELVDYG